MADNSGEDRSDTVEGKFDLDAVEIRNRLPFKSQWSNQSEFEPGGSVRCSKLMRRNASTLRMATATGRPTGTAEVRMASGGWPQATRCAPLIARLPAVCLARPRHGPLRDFVTGSMENPNEHWMERYMISERKGV